MITHGDIGSLLGKKLGGTRCIALCATYYRLLFALLKAAVREWDVAVGLEGDSALPGKSVLLESALLQVEVEQHAIAGRKRCSFYGIPKSFSAR